MGKPWFDFLICLFLGRLGVHKFIGKKYLMGVLYLFTGGLFYIGWIYDCVGYLVAAIKESAARKKESGRQLSDLDPLPVAVSENVLLTSGEVCHYASVAVLVKPVQTEQEGTGETGMQVVPAEGVQMMKRFTAPEQAMEKTPGMLTITSKRVIFAGNGGGFNQRIMAISSLIPQKNGLIFQFGEQQFLVLTKEPERIHQILTRIVNSTTI